MSGQDIPEKFNYKNGEKNRFLFSRLQDLNVRRHGLAFEFQLDLQIITEELQGFCVEGKSVPGMNRADSRPHSS